MVISNGRFTNTQIWSFPMVGYKYSNMDISNGRFTNTQIWSFPMVGYEYSNMVISNGRRGFYIWLHRERMRMCKYLCRNIF